MRKLNVRLVLVLLLVGGVLAGVVHSAHELQIGRTAKLLLTMADREEAADELVKAANSLARYVQLKPDDNDALARLGSAQLKLGNPFAAFGTLERVLRREPTRDKERHAIVAAAMRIGRFADARNHLREHVLKDHPDEAESLDLLGQCQAALGEFSEAAATYEAVLATRADALGTYARLAELLALKLERAADADAVMDRMVENNESSHQAWLLRARYRSDRRMARALTDESGHLLTLAADDARRAVELAPEDADVLLVAADLVRRQPASARPAEQGAEQEKTTPDDEARSYLEAGIKAHPADPRLYRALASLEFETGRHDAALAVARSGLEEIPGEAGLAWTLTELLILDRRLDEAEAEIAKLRADSQVTAPVDYLAARLLIARGKLSDASRLLDKLQPKLVDWPDLARQANLWAGRCYDQLERVDDQLAAFRRAVAADGQWAPARLGLASSLLKVGRFDEAVEECRLAAAMPGFPTEGLISLARMMIVQRLREAAAERDWRGVGRVLELADEQMPDSLDVPELKAEALLAQNQPDAARTCLAGSSERHPDEVRVWLSRAALEARLGDASAAGKLLADAQQRLGDSADLRVGRARLLAQKPDENTAKALAALASGMEQFEKPAQARLATVLAFALRSVGEKKQAVEFAERANSLDADNLPARLLLFDLAVETREAASLEKLLAEIRRIEGPEGGPLSRYGQALRLVIGAKASDTQRLEDARRQLTEARLQRPAWARVPLLEAQIEELRGNTAGATEYYQQALELGLRQPGIVQRLVTLLFAQRRFAEADQALRKLDDEQTPFTSELGRLASKVSLQVEDYTRAIDMARKTCATSTEFSDHVWLGQLAGALARGVRTEASKRQQLADEAETAFRRAAELAPKEPEVWVALVQHLVRTRQTTEVDEALAKAVERISPKDLPLVLAECYQSMSRIKEAVEQFELALKAQPDDLLTVHRAAEFHIKRRAFSEAEPLLERLLDSETKASPADVSFARRGLALVRAGSGSYQKLREAIVLLDENLAANPLSAEDRKNKALLLARSPAHADRRAAIESLEEVLRQATHDNAARLLLAQLYLGDRETPEARRQYQALLADSPDNAAYIVNYVRLLLQGGEIEEAGLWLGRLEKLAPTAIETEELKARELVARGETQAAIDRLMALLPPAEEPPPEPAQPQPAQPLSNAGEAKAAASPRVGPERIALILEGMAGAAARRGLTESDGADDGSKPEAAGSPPAQDNESSKLLIAAAEKLLRQLVVQHKDKPAVRAALAAFLGRHGRAAEALDIWKGFFGDDRFEAAAVGCSYLAAARQLDVAQLADVERQLLKAHDEHAESLPVLSALAVVYDAQAKYDEAARTYQAILGRDDKNVVALNNLALNLAQRNKARKSTLELIDRALADRGPVPTLLDTRASVHLALGDAKRAVSDLEEAVAQEPAAAYYFHLARAQLMRGDREALAAAFGHAKEAGLREESLHALERIEYRRVLAAVSPK